MTALVLDSEAFNALAGPITDRRRMVAQLMSAAFGEGRPVIVPTVVLAELYRPGRMAIVDSCLARSEEAPMCRDTDRELARLVGGVLAAAGAGSELMVDAHVVATAVEAARAVIVTGDPDDVSRLAAPFPNVTVVPLI